MVVVIPHDFEASIVRTGVGQVQLSVNAEKGSAAGIVQAYASRVLAQYAGELSRDPWVRRPWLAELGALQADLSTFACGLSTT